MQKFYQGILLLVFFVLSISAQQVNIFGKVRDTTGSPQQGVIVSLAAHPNIVDTTDKVGSFSLIGQVSSILISKDVFVKPFTSFNGNMVCFAVSEPTAVSIEVFNTLGQQLAKPLNSVMAAGSYRIPIQNGFAHQNLFVRVRRGNVNQVFSMQGINSSRNTGSTSLINISSVTGKSSAVLSKSSVIPAIDTLVFSRRGFVSSKLPISSYTPTDSINTSLYSITDPYLICYALNLVPQDTNRAVHFRDDTTYLLSVVAANVGGGNAYSSEVYVSCADTDIVVSPLKSSLSNVQSGTIKTGSPIVFLIKKRLTPGRKVQLNFHFIDSWSGTTREWFDTLYWAPKPFLYMGAILDDDNIAPTSGNGNLKVEPGEKIGIAPVFKNMCTIPLTSITGRILSTYAGLDTLTKNNYFPWMVDTLAPGKDGTLDSEFVSVVSPTLKFYYNVTPLIKDSARYDMLLSARYAGGNCQWLHPVYCLALSNLPPPCTLAVNVTNGTVSKNPDKADYFYGDTIWLTANPFQGYRFTTWGGAVTGNENPVKVLLSKNTLITATMQAGIPFVIDKPVTDIDGNVYQTLKIGDQVWTIDNFRATKYNDGTSIPLVTETDWSIWRTLTTPGFCYLKASQAGEVDETLYNWYVVSPSNIKKIAPAGWHVPTSAEWGVLENVFKAAKYIRGEFGSIFRAGYRNDTGSFEDRSSVINCWSSTESDSSCCANRSAIAFDTHANLYIYRLDNMKNYGYSIRLVRD